MIPITTTLQPFTEDIYKISMTNDPKLSGTIIAAAEAVFSRAELFANSGKYHTFIFF